MNQNKFDKIIRIGRIMNSGYFLEKYFFVFTSYSMLFQIHAIPKASENSLMEYHGFDQV